MKAIFLAAAGWYFFSRAADRNGYHFLDNVDLVIHEAGHVIFLPFGEFIGMAGGTILQLLAPLVFVAYFFLREERFSAGIMMLWLGQSFINVARYAGDAIAMELPLIGGGIHDWNWMLTSLNMLNKTALVSDAFYYSGAAAITAGVIVAGASLFGSKNELSES